jgi:type IV pilus assembly protein PilW
VKIKSIKYQAGVTMVELMVAMLLSVMLGGAVISVFVNSTQNFNQDENILGMQDDARHALRQISFDVSMAGHYADLVVPSVVTPDPSLVIGTDCGPAGQLNWMYRTVDAGTGDSLSITALDNATGAQVVAAHSCFLAGELLPGTDVVAIKRVVGGAAVPTNGGIYLRTNGTVGLLYREPAVAPAIVVAPPNADWEFRPSIYYIRQFADVPGDGIPTLCRKTLAGAGPSMTTECLATGIENLQLEYGIDTTSDGQPNVFLSNPSLAQIQDVVSARIFVLARTTEIDVRYTNAKTFSISNSPDYAPNDSFHRRVFSTSVSIQNIRSMNMMGF